jgi:hypothetical protein
MELLSSIFDALTLTNVLGFKWAGETDLANDGCVRDDCPEFQDPEEYVRTGVDKSGNIEGILKGSAEASTSKRMNTVTKEKKELPTIEEVDETEEEEPTVPNHIIM